MENNPNHSNGAGIQTGASTVAGTALPTLGRIVHVNFPAGVDGATEAAGIVTAVHGDGSINVYVFPPNGGAPFSLTGARSVAERDALPSDSADRNLPAWYWPPRP